MGELLFRRPRWLSRGTSASSRRDRALIWVAAVLACASVFFVGTSPVGALPRRSGVGSSQTSTSSNNWAQFHYGAARNGSNPNETTLGTSNVGRLTMKWRAWANSTGGYSGSSPAISGGVVYVGSDDTNVYAFNASTGSLVWKFKTGGKVDSSPAVVDGVVYVGSNDGKVYALNASNGTKKWSFTTGDQIANGSPVVANGMVYIGSYDGYFRALDASNGMLKWKSSNIWAMWKGGAISGGIVYVGTDKSMLYAFDGDTGATKWSKSLGGRVRSNPSVSNGTVYVGCDDGRLYAYNATSGSLKWKTAVLPGAAPVLVRSSPAEAGGLVYITTSEGDGLTANGHTYAFDATSGVQEWVHGLPDMSGVSPVVANGVVYSSTFGHNYYAYNAGNGKQLWNAGFDIFAGNTGSPAVVNGNLYFLNKDGYLYDFGL